VRQRNLFRSTASHSTVQIDETEQNSIEEQTPFLIGDEARARILEWQTDDARDTVVAEHDGYRRFSQPVTHRRAVRFDKRKRFWLVEDSFSGQGEHEFAFRFHLAPGLKSKLRTDSIVEIRDEKNGARLFISARGLEAEPQFESRFSSRDYGEKQPSHSVCWRKSGATNLKAEFTLIPARAGEDERERLAILSERS